MASTSGQTIEQTPEHHKHDYAAANQKHWDDHASRYRQQGPGSFLAAKSAEAIQRAYHFNAQTTIALDYACGPGLISEAVAHQTKLVVGADASGKMVEQYRMTATQLGLNPTRMRAMHVENLVGAPGELDGLSFDVVFCALSLHHFSDVGAMTSALAAQLNPGGRLLIIDIDSANDIFGKILASTRHAHSHVTHMHGFSREQLKALLDGISILEDVQVETAFTVPLSDLARHTGPDQWTWLKSDEAKQFEAEGKMFTGLMASATRTA